MMVYDIYLPPCRGYSKEEWIRTEVALLNDHDTPLADGVCGNINPKGCVDANPLGDEDVQVSIFNYFGAYGGASGLAVLSLALAALECYARRNKLMEPCPSS